MNAIVYLKLDCEYCEDKLGCVCVENNVISFFDADGCQCFVLDDQMKHRRYHMGVRADLIEKLAVDIAIDGKSDTVTNFGDDCWCWTSSFGDQYLSFSPVQLAEDNEADDDSRLGAINIQYGVWSRKKQRRAKAATITDASVESNADGLPNSAATLKFSTAINKIGVQTISGGAIPQETTRPVHGNIVVTSKGSVTVYYATESNWQNRGKLPNKYAEKKQHRAEIIARRNAFFAGPQREMHAFLVQKKEEDNRRRDIEIRKAEVEQSLANLQSEKTQLEQQLAQIQKKRRRDDDNGDS